jgi:cytochrome b
MNTVSASRADDGATTPVLVWDAPVRVFHWLLVLCFAGAWLTGESERWRLVHLTLGYTMAGLVAFRVVWGLLGTRHARFSGFVRGPRAVARYLGSLLRGRPEHHAGHNPAGGLAIVGLLLLAAGVTATGWAMDFSLAGHWLEDVHEGAASLMLALVAVHVAAVVLSSWLHGENLVATMIDGRKRAAPHEGIRRAWRSMAALVLCAVLGFWWLQWQDAPAGGVVASPSGGWAKMSDHDDD